MRWKAEVRKYYGNKCVITGKTDCKIDVHHLYSYSDLIEECCSELNLPIKETVSEYEILDYMWLKDLFKSKHTLDMGITIDKDIHLKYHTQYRGIGINPNTFDEFLRKEYNTTLEKIRSASV